MFDRPEDFGFDEIPSEEEEKIPDCKKTFSLDFSMHTFEHFSVSFSSKFFFFLLLVFLSTNFYYYFQAMRNKKKLVQQPEKSLLKLFPSNMDLSTLGHNIANGLMRNNTSWLHLNLASIYWRIRGNAHNAIECARRAVVKAPM